MFLHDTSTGVRSSVFTNDLKKLHYLLQLHGFSNLSHCVRECKIMLVHHLINGDCLRYDHLCKVNTLAHDKLPDRTACRVVSSGFSEPIEITKTIMDIIGQASAKQISTDRLLILVDSIGITEQFKCKESKCRHLLKSLQKFVTQTEHRAASETVSYDAFHDLLLGIERCNAGTLKAIMARHRITVGPRTKRNEMINSILKHISDGHCWQKNAEGQQHPDCHSINQIISPHDGVSDRERKIKILQYLKDTFPCLPLARLMDIEGVEYGPNDSLKNLQAKLNEHIEHLKFQENTEIKNTWPSKISSNLKDKIASMFLKETSSEALSTFVCASCAEDTLSTNKISVTDGDLSLKPLHRPDICCAKSSDFPVDNEWLDTACEHPQFPVSKIDPDALLDENGISLSYDGMKKILSFCPECYKNIKKGKTPPLALANHMVLGEIPPELQDLTIVEEAMIARCQAKTWVVQLQEKTESINLPNVQRGLKGHTIIYPQQPESLAQILPPTVAEICTPICVIFMGSQLPSKEWLRTKAKPLVVR